MSLNLKLSDGHTQYYWQNASVCLKGKNGLDWRLCKPLESMVSLSNTFTFVYTDIFKTFS